MDNNMRDNTGIYIVVLIGVIILMGGASVALYNYDWFVETVDFNVNVHGTMVAMVKGSIYARGEPMSVFGTCFDGYGIPVPNSTGHLSAWFPNGTQYLIDQQMDNMTIGYFVFPYVMGDVGGTYLTEFECTNISNGETVRAWGEWQNPEWANSIENISSDVIAQVNAVNNSIVTKLGDINSSISTNIINFRTNTTGEFYDVRNDIATAIYTANASVDRNNSLIVSLLLQLLNYSLTPGAGLNLYWSETADPAYFRKDWNLRVDATADPDNRSIWYPDIQCLVNTTNTGGVWQYMTSEGNHFIYTETVTTLESFSYNTRCIWS